MVSLLLFFGVNDAYAETKLTASDAAADDRFGNSVSVHDDLVAVGTRYNDDNGSNSGSAYVYEKVNGVWTETKLTASDAAAGDQFGHSVSVYDDLVAVGAHFNDDNGSNSGSAYVYEKVNGVWTETKLTASDAAANDWFGHSVSVHDDLVAVGTRYNDDNGSNSGSAYVYEKVNGVWTETKLTASDAAANDWFGHSVSVHDDLVAVGAIYNDDGGTNSGSAYVYEKVNGVWTETKLTASDAAAGDQFGFSVSVYDDLVAVSAVLNDDGGYNSGSAYVYEKVNGVWTETKLTASDAAANDWFGHSVSVHDDLVAVGAIYNDDGGTNSGSAYVYEKVNGVWTETKLTASDAAAGDQFGFSVSVYDDLVAVSAVLNDDGGYNSGSAYVYEKVNGVWTETKLTASDAAAGDQFGHSVSVYDDLVAVGTRYNDDNGSNSGSAYVYEKVNGVWTETKLTASDAAANDWFGYSVSVYDDLVAVGAIYNDDNGSNSGSAYVYGTIPPTITIAGYNPQYITIGSGYTELGAITNDGSTVAINSSSFVDSIGSYSIYYDSSNAFGNAVQKIRNVTVYSTGNFTIGNLSISEINPLRISPISFDRKDIEHENQDINNSVLITIEYPASFDLDCNVKNKFAHTNQNYTDITGQTISTYTKQATFSFTNFSNEVITMYCYDSITGEGSTYVIANNDFPMLELFDNFRGGTFGTSGKIGELDFITVIIIIVSMIGFNRKNPVVGVIINAMVIGAAVFLQIIQFETVMISAIATVVMFVIFAGRNKS